MSGAPLFDKDQSQSIASNNTAPTGGDFDAFHIVSFVAMEDVFSGSDRAMILQWKSNNNARYHLEYRNAAPIRLEFQVVASGTATHQIPVAGTDWTPGQYSMVECIYTGSQMVGGIDRVYTTPQAHSGQLSTGNRMTTGADFNAPLRRFFSGRLWHIVFDCSAVNVVGGAEADGRLDESDVAWLYDGGNYRARNEIEGRNWDTPGVVVYHSYLGPTDDYAIDRGVLAKNLTPAGDVLPIPSGAPPKDDTDPAPPPHLAYFRKFHHWQGERTDAEQDGDEAALLS